MRLRLLTALLLIPPLALLIGWSPRSTSLQRWHEVVYVLVILAAVETSYCEYVRLSRRAGWEAMSAEGYAGAALLCVVQLAELHSSTVPGMLVLGTASLVLLAIPSLALRRSADLSHFIARSASTLFGVFYLGFLFSFLIPLRFTEPDTGRRATFFLFFVIYFGDFFAFAVGRTMGKRPLVPRVSPRKTVEGAVAGFLGSLLVAGLFQRWFWQTTTLKTAILLGAWIAIAGQFGDLVESGLKRAAEVKDSGTMLPGHGGMLDRIDSILFGAPAMWLGLGAANFWR